VTILYDLKLWGIALQIVVIVTTGTLGFVTLGTFYGAMASRVRAREVLLPLLLFPMLIPVLLAAVQATRAALAGNGMGYMDDWIKLVVVFDVIFLVASLAAFEQVIGE
jgi:heme exporter protein B